jgi:isopenicillin-N epimerase
MPIHAPTSNARVIKSPQPIRADIAADFALDPSYAFLNHGSFGARPRAVIEAQQRRRMEFEARPIEWLDRKRNPMIEHAKDVLGRFIGALPQNFGFVTNATGGINAVLRSLTFRAGDELLTTNHVYNAVRQTMKYVAERIPGGAKYVEIEIPLPVSSPDEITIAIEAAITSRTRVVVIDHVSSPTAIIFPVKDIVRMCAARGVDVLIDGAHAPGMLPLNIEEIGAAYYSGNLHKWMCAPVGAAFIWVRPDKQRDIHPTTISHFLNEGFTNEFNWQGTRDITPWLCVEDAMKYLERLGWDRVMRHNHELAAWVQRMLCDRWNVEPGSPVDGSMIGSMATVQLPGQEILRRKFPEFLQLRERVFNEFRIEVPVVDWMGKLWVRPCCQVYNQSEQYERLADAVLAIVG